MVIAKNQGFRNYQLLSIIINYYQLLSIWSNISPILMPQKISGIELSGLSLCRTIKSNYMQHTNNCATTFFKK